MKRILSALPLIFSLFLFFGVAALWVLSYRTMHSIGYSRSVGGIRLLWDKGILQVDLVRGDTTDRGFEWDAHRRSASGGKATLNMFKPKAGLGRFFADLGFAQWSYSWYTNGWFSKSLPGLVVFCPLWFVILFPALFLAWEIRATTFARNPSRAKDNEGIVANLTASCRRYARACFRRAGISNPAI